jgi:hypothetical protein
MNSRSFSVLTAVLTLTIATLIAPKGYCGAPPPSGSPSRPVTESGVDLVELSLGFNYIRLDHAGPENKNLAGFDVSAFVNVTSWLGLGGEFMADFGRKTLVARVGNDLTVDSRRYVYVFGPRVTVWQNPNFRLFTEVLAGGVSAEAKARQGSLHAIATDDTFAAALGAGFDWRFSRHFAWRVVEADYLPTNLGDQWQNNFRAATGLVYSFGRK